MKNCITILALLFLGCGAEITPINKSDMTNADLDVQKSDAGNRAADVATADDVRADLPIGDLSAARKGWTDEVPVASDSRQETAVVALDGRVYVLGGYNRKIQMVATVESYDPQTKAWAQHADLPVKMHHANAAAYDGEIYVLGFLGPQGFSADPRSFVYDPESDAWSLGTDLPSDRRRGSSAIGVIDGLIYLAGGLRNGAVREVDVFDPVAKTWTALPPLPRDVDHMAFAAVGGKLIVASGRDSGISALSSQVDIFDTVAQTWSLGAPIPTPRGGVAGAKLDGKLYVFGGEGNPAPGSNGVFADVEVYDVAADSWERLPPMANPRHGMGAATVDGVIYVPGGADVQAFGAVETHDSYVPE